MWRTSIGRDVCISCRLHAQIRTRQLLRARTPSKAIRSLSSSAIQQSPRTRSSPQQASGFRSSRSRFVDRVRGSPAEDDVGEYNPDDTFSTSATPEERVLRIRRDFGDRIPRSLITSEELEIYEKLYGKPRLVEDVMEDEEQIDEYEQSQELEEEGGDRDDLDESMGTGVLRENSDGELEEVEYDDDLPVYGEKSRADRRTRGQDQFAEDIEQALTFRGMGKDINVQRIDDEQTPRTHPLTELNRFGTSPLAIALPRAKYIEPTAMMLKASPNVHLASAAHRVFGGFGLPQSASTPARSKVLQQKPIALEAAQPSMSPIEGDSYLAAMIPALFACLTGTLVETRKRLGTAWGEELVRKAAAGRLRILDAGGGGAGVMAVREVLRAEWERMHEDQVDSATGIASADGKLGGSGVDAPLGKATVLIGSQTLRKRMSMLLEDTSFIPRLPNYARTDTARLAGKYDIIVAPHSIWPLREDYLRKAHVQNLWSLLSNDGGVLILMEKGTSRGFEVIAGAREMLLEHHIASPGSETRPAHIDEVSEIEPEGTGTFTEAKTGIRNKDVGMIIAPCTNHTACPMYVPKGKVKGRKDICAFEQRYVRPRYLQTILGAKEKNWEDVAVSYLSVMRGRDLRKEPESALEQGEAATDRAFEGFQPPQPINSPSEDDTTLPHSLSLPRLVMQPLKRQGHVILDVCTPAGSLERWTVPKSFGKQAYRDARKSTWGDLWAMGAKFRRPRDTHVSKHARREVEAEDSERPSSSRGNVKRSGEKGKDKGRDANQNRNGPDVDEYGHLVFGEKDIPLDGGKVRTRKIKGIRDKRDKKGTGNGRRKAKEYD